ncbi:MAG TPA: M1 family metallopeptidase [Anaerolineae bacterium]|nr:M1 family metallopeptidase [Anaerolineae bacterium]
MILKRMLWWVLLVGCLVGCGGDEVVEGENRLWPRPTRTLAPVAGGQSIGDPYIPELGNTGYLVQDYQLKLRLDPAVEWVEGETVIQAVSRWDGLAQISLDFVGFTLAEVLVDGVGVNYQVQGKKLVVRLPETLAAGRTFTVKVVYYGAPTREASRHGGYAPYLGLTYPGNGTIYTLAQPDGARYWFPSNDHPRDKATFSFELTVPAGVMGVASGVWQRSEEVVLADGRVGRTDFWRQDYPMATYLAMVAVGPYVPIESVAGNGVLLQHYVFPAVEAEFRAEVVTMDEAMVWFSQRLGAYPFSQFGFATVSIPNISMETQPVVSLSTNFINEQIMIHELSHMWFGNWVSLDSWGDIWRNEGMATYMEYLWIYRNDPVGLEQALMWLEGQVNQQATAIPLANLPAEEFLGFDSYSRGALVAHKLHEEMGDEAFWAGWRLYFERYGGGTATEAEFEAVMSEAAGRDLSLFFNQWVCKC